VTGEVQTACAKEPTPGGRDLARPVAAPGPAARGPPLLMVIS